MTTESPRRKSILIVEDDMDVREAVAQALTEEGYHVVVAKNGRFALERLKEMTTVPGLILLDLKMPDMDGWQFRTEQQKLEQICAIPVVLLSAAVNLKANAVSLNAAGFISKPVGIGTLLAVAERFCRPADTLR